MKCDILIRSLKDSAADSKLKLLKDGETFGVEKPGGEKRIHIGAKNNESEYDSFFFPKGGDTVTVTVSKIDLIRYIIQAKDEYLNPKQNYRLRIADYYDEKLQQTYEIKDDFFQVCFKKNTDNSRYYLTRPSGNNLYKNYNYIINICLPLITNYVFLRVENEGNYSFFIKPEFITPKIAKGTQIKTLDLVNSNYKAFFAALRTKPFLLLAGISGTGKSRKVQELAYLTCKRDGYLDQDETSPGNYLLIPVKPNWHDSTELLGYYSSISGKYILTDFIRFVWKAWQHRDTPFFICLDEMNLAPVEQYFAEYLSVIETRKRVKDEVTGEYYIQTAELLPKKTFENLDVKEPVVSAKPEGDYVIDDSIKITNAYKGDDYQIMLFLKENGLRIPDNLFVIGTVNMDDTTHQFSRKVIDRAFTIEMNGGNLKDMFVEHDTLSYQQEPLALDAVKPRFVKAADVLEFYKEDAEIIKEEVPKLLEYINGENIFKDTPFRVSYRVQNELIIYYAAIRPEGTLQEEEVKNYLKQAFMSILLEKVLPRVEGDEKTMRCDEKNDSTILLNLKSYLENYFKPKEPSGEITSEGDAEENDEKKDSKLTYNKANVYSLLIDKLDEMNKRVKSSYFTSFFS